MNIRPWVIEACLVVALFAAAAWWSTAYWNASFKAGRQPIFYQEYFEPAVMMACGKGFVIAHPQMPAMEAFLFRRVDRFSCSDIPADAKLGTEGVYQGVWRYLMIATAVAWRILGISWSGMGPFFGVLFAATIVLDYAILRLGTGRLLALFGAFALSVSTLHLLNLPHLRDYSKAPLTLALILILGITVKARPTRRALLGCAAAYGLALGVGYGFRTDFLVNIPVFVLVLFAFVDGGVRRNLRLKAASAALCLAVFLVTAWPIISNVYRSGGCQWHTALLGLTTPFTEGLNVDEAPYDWGANYADGFIYKTAVSYGRRMHPGVGHIEYCGHEYDAVSGQYLIEVARRFPADMLTRAYASVATITNLPFMWYDAPLNEFAPTPYRLRARLLAALQRTGITWVAAAILLVASVSVRLAWFLGFFLLYFGGYPAIQFANRHYFHLELITWWALAFVAHHVGVAAMRRVRSEQPSAAAARPNWQRAAWVLPAMLAAAVVPLLALRGYQQLTLRAFFDRYLQAPVDELPLEPGHAGGMHAVPPPPAADTETGESFMVVTLNAWRCADGASVTFRYDKAFLSDDLSRTFKLAQRSARQQSTRIFTPVYKHFVGVEFSDIHPGCIGSVSRVRDLQSLSLLLPAILPPRWEHEALYQRLKFWPVPRPR